MLVYLDNAASTVALESVTKKMTDILLNDYSNPSSSSTLAIRADNIIKEARKDIASIINAYPDEIYFTSGGTESDNWAIFGTADAYKKDGKHFITTKIEHAAVEMPFRKLREDGYDTEFIDVDGKGNLDMEKLKKSIRKDTVLVSTILISNEMGTVQDVEKIGEAIKSVNPKTLYHVDGVQAFGKYDIDVKKMKIDMLSVSAHKFHGPKGVGALYIKSGLKVKPIIYGGGQQKNMRAGTENAAGIAGLALAAKEIYQNIETSKKHVMGLKKMLAKGILEEIPDTYLNGESFDKATPYVLSIAFSGIKSEVLLHALEGRDIFVSAGSACNSKKKTGSTVLGAMGIDEDLIDGSIRFSFSRFNTEAEVAKCIDVLKELVPILRKVTSLKG